MHLYRKTNFLVPLLAEQLACSILLHKCNFSYFTWVSFMHWDSSWVDASKRVMSFIRQNRERSKEILWCFWFVGGWCLFFGIFLISLDKVVALTVAGKLAFLYCILSINTMRLSISSPSKYRHVFLLKSEREPNKYMYI